MVTGCGPIISELCADSLWVISILYFVGFALNHSDFVFVYYIVSLTYYRDVICDHWIVIIRCDQLFWCSDAFYNLC